MSLSEHDLQNLIRLKLGTNPNVRLFRNNVGTGWQGTMVSHKNGVVTLRNARPLHAGLFTGSSDLIGWATENGVARFCSLEIKTAKGRASDAQELWIETVQKAGGIAEIIRSPEEAAAMFQ